MRPQTDKARCPHCGYVLIAGTLIKKGNTYLCPHCKKAL